MNKYHDKVVLITGGSRGLGRALAKEFARRRAKLALLDLAGVQWGDAVAELEKSGATRVYLGTADVTKPEQLRDEVRRAESALGVVEVLIANAGVGIDTSVAPFALEGFTQSVDVNLTGMANSIAAVLPGMQERRKGQIVGIVSVAAYRGLPGLAGYCASKAGALALMDSMRLDLKQYGIRCTTVCPGWINTGVFHTLTSAKPGVVQVPLAADKIVRGIERGKTFISFPFWLRSLFVLNRIQPTGIGDWMLRLFWGWFGGK